MTSRCSGGSTPRDEFFFPRRDGEGEMIGVRLYHVCLGDFDFGKKHSVPMLLTLGPKFLAIPKQRGCEVQDSTH